MAPARQMKNKHNCKKLVIDVPIAPKEIVEDLKLIAHKVIALYFRTIWRCWTFLSDFTQVSDDEVQKA